jgi:2OG-Fe(II) oxygenase superfamily
MAYPVSGIRQIVLSRLRENEVRLKSDFNQPGKIRCCWLDDLLPLEILHEALGGLPNPAAMVRRQSLKERKYVTAALDQLGDATRNLVAAFSGPEIAEVVTGLLGGARLSADPRLYNGGITKMMPGDFMCPHLDNSHNYDRTQRRAVVLLYYMSPEWREDYGGALELWDDDRKAPPREIAHQSNRLVIMETTDHSWHAVRPISGPHSRINVTTYYYAPKTEITPARLTRFAPWPGQPVRGLYFNADFHIRSLAARFLGGVSPLPNGHINPDTQSAAMEKPEHPSRSPSQKASV